MSRHQQHQQLRPRAGINDIFNPAKVPGSSVYAASNGTDLGVQAIFAGSFFAVFILLFSVLRLRWPFIFSPRTRLTITAPPFLSRRFFGWLLATMRTPEAHILNTLGLDSVIFLRFYKMCMRLLLDVAFFSIVIIWPINIRWSKANLDPESQHHVSTSSDDGGGVDNDDFGITLTYSVTDYLFNLTLNTNDPKQKWNLVPHIVFAYVFSGLAYYHISKFSSRWASLRWHFLMRSRHALVSRTVMLTGVPRHLASSPRELEWFWGPGLQLGKIERVRVCPFNTRLTSSARERAKYLVKLEHAYMKLLGNPCAHPDYDPERLRKLALDPSDAARVEEDELLVRWCKPSRRRRVKQRMRQTTDATLAAAAADNDDQKCKEKTEMQSEKDSSQVADAEHPVAVSVKCELGDNQSDGQVDSSEVGWTAKRPMIWIRSGGSWWRPWSRVDEITHWRTKFIAADQDFGKLRKSLAKGEDDYGRSTTAFVTFEDAASAHIVTQLSCYPNPGYMKAKLAPEPRGVYWPNIWISSRRKWAGFTLKWICIFVIWAFWSVPVILFSSLLAPSSLERIFPSLMEPDHKILRSFLSSTVPSVFLLLFLNMLPWILKQVHFATGVRTKPDIDYSVLTKMWAFLVFNVILVFGFSGTFWDQILNVVNNPGTVMQKLATNIPKVGTFFTGYILVLGVGYQPFKLLQLRPVIWHIGRQWLCSTPRDYARLVSPVYIDWYSVYPYPLLVFTIAMIYSTFSPPVVLGAVIYYVIGYPVMKYLLLYVYFHPFETAGMVWPRVCRRMIFAIILYQVVILTFVIVKGGGWYTFSMVPIIVLYMWFFYYVGWSLEKQGTVLPVYLWRNPPPDSSYPLPPDSELDPGYDDRSYMAQNNHTAGTPGFLDTKAASCQSLGASENGGGSTNDYYHQHMRELSGQASAPLKGHAGSPLDPFADYNKTAPATTKSKGTKGSRGAAPTAIPHRLQNSTFPSPRSPIAAAFPQGRRVSKRTASNIGIGSGGGGGGNAGHHRRESSRGARTREIILAGRGISNPSSPEVGSHKMPAGNNRSTKRGSGAMHSRRSSLVANNATNAILGSKKSSASSLSNMRSGSGESQHRGRRQRRNSPVGAAGVQARRGIAPHLQKAKRKRYKSLAEAATVEGSRLIVSLGRLPSELHSRYTNGGIKRSLISTEDSSLGDGDSAGVKRWSLSGLNLFGSGKTSKDDEGDSCQQEQEHHKHPLASYSLGGSSSPSADKSVAIGDSGFNVPSTYYEPAGKPSPTSASKSRYDQTRVHLHSPLVQEVCGLPLQPNKRPSMLRREVHIVSLDTQSQRDSSDKLKEGSKDGGNDDDDEGDWSDVSSDAEDSDTGAAAKNPAGPAVPSQPADSGDQKRAGQSWDPLVYLKSASTESPAQPPCSPRDGVSLGTLLTSVAQANSTGVDRPLAGTSSYTQRKFASDVINDRGPPPPTLRRRNRRLPGARTDSVSSNGYESSADDSAPSVQGSHAGAEGPRSRYSATPGPSGEPVVARNALVSRAKETFQRIRDYFLADFRPAGPILDLTYDRLYAQGGEGEEHEASGGQQNMHGEHAEDNGDSIPPLREILDRVLPRAMSRTFSQSPMRQTPPLSATANAADQPSTRRLGAAGGAHTRSVSMASPSAEGRMQPNPPAGWWPNNSPQIFPASTTPIGAGGVETRPRGAHNTVPAKSPLAATSPLQAAKGAAPAASLAADSPGYPRNTHMRTMSATSPVFKHSMSPTSDGASLGAGGMLPSPGRMSNRDRSLTAGAGRGAGHNRGMSLAQVLDSFADSGQQQDVPTSSASPLGHSRGNSIQALRSLFTRRPTLSVAPDHSNHQALETAAAPLLPSTTTGAAQCSMASNQQQPDALADESFLPPLPRPPRAPWMAREELKSPRSAAHSNDSQRSTHSANWLQRELSHTPSSVESLMLASHGRLDMQSRHKNSLPPPRAPLPMRIVSELNYTARRSTTAAGITYSVAPNLLPPREDPSGDLLIANYQRFAVEAQSTFEPDEFTDYSQTPMLNFRGILDRGIQDYVHPGLVGELPTLWLPVKRTPSGEASASAGDSSAAAEEAPQVVSKPDTPTDALHMLALSAPQRFVGRVLHWNRHPEPSAAMDVTYNEQAYYASNPSESQNQQSIGYASELQEVLVHPRTGPSSSSLAPHCQAGEYIDAETPDEHANAVATSPQPHEQITGARHFLLTPILEVATPRSSIAVSPEMSPMLSDMLPPIGEDSDGSSSGSRTKAEGIAAVDSVYGGSGDAIHASNPSSDGGRGSGGDEIGCRAHCGSVVSKDGSCDPLLENSNDDAHNV